MNGKRTKWLRKSYASIGGADSGNYPTFKSFKRSFRNDNRITKFKWAWLEKTLAELERRNPSNKEITFDSAKPAKAGD